MTVCVWFRTSFRVWALTRDSSSYLQRNNFIPFFYRLCEIEVAGKVCFSLADRIVEVLAMISLYRGELHKVSGVPCQWTVPKSTIPVAVFIKALKKRNAALLRELQSSSSPEKLLLPSSVTLVRPGESVKVTPSRITRETVPNEVIASGTRCGRVGYFIEESKNTILAGKRAGSSEPIEEESEILQERKRTKQDDIREEIDRQTPKDDDERTVAENQEKRTTLESKDSVRGLESMALDAVDRSEEMDCDIVETGEKTGSDCAEEIAEEGRVRVSDLGTVTELEVDLGKHVGSNDSNDDKVDRDPDLAKNGEQASPQVNRSPGEFSKDTEVGDLVVERLSDKTARKRKREELQAKLKKLTADKHHLVLILKQVLNEEESKKRISSANPPQLAGPGFSGAVDTQVVASHGEKVGGSQPCGDLEEGELEYARTPSPPPRLVQSNHSSLNSHNVVGLPPSIVPILGRQNTLTQHISQGSSGRGGYYVPGTGIPPSPVGPGIGGGALSPGAVYMGNLPSPLGPHNYSHNLALQHAAAIHAQKIVPQVHGQFNTIPPNGSPLGAGPGVAGGPPGFGGYVVPPPLHPHHPHLSQTAAASTSHIPVQQGVVSSSLLTTPRGPVGYHDMRLGVNAWIPR